MKTTTCYCGKIIYVEDDFPDTILRKPWNCASGNVVTSIGNGNTLSIANFILDVPQGYEPDHRDRNPHNNLKSNLRLATHAENNWNKGPHSDSTSGVKGVWWDRTRQKWVAEITANGKKSYLGRFDDKQSAADAYDEAAKKLHGEFAFLNGKTNTLSQIEDEFSETRIDFLSEFF